MAIISRDFSLALPPLDTLCKPSLVTMRTCLLDAEMDNHCLWSYTLVLLPPTQ